MNRLGHLDYEAKVSHPQYRHLEAHGKGRKKYYYAMSGTDAGHGLSHVFLTMKTGSTYDGTVNGNDVAWKASITNPMPLTLAFSGKVDGDSISGDVSIGPMGSFPFKGKRA